MVHEMAPNLWGFAHFLVILATAFSRCDRAVACRRICCAKQRLEFSLVWQRDNQPLQTKVLIYPTQFDLNKKYQIEECMANHLLIVSRNVEQIIVLLHRHHTAKAIRCHLNPIDIVHQYFVFISLCFVWFQHINTVHDFDVCVNYLICVSYNYPMWWATPYAKGDAIARPFSPLTDRVCTERKYIIHRKWPLFKSIKTILHSLHTNIMQMTLFAELKSKNNIGPLRLCKVKFSLLATFFCLSMPSPHI